MLGGVGSDSGDCQQPMVMVMCYAAAPKFDFDFLMS
jgi:hypothetical protein